MKSPRDRDFFVYQSNNTPLPAYPAAALFSAKAKGIEPCQRC
ncbi:MULTISPECIES: hypothetical protein [Brucella]|nr:hypothetical protein [Brucella intermedia]